MLADKFDGLKDNLKRIVMVTTAVVLSGFFTVLLLAPEALSDFVGGIHVVVRVLILAAFYGTIAAITYFQLRAVTEDSQVQGLVVKSAGLLTSLSINSARDRILEVIRDVPDVHSASADVSSRHGRVLIVLDVVLKGGDIVLPDKQKEINRALGKVVKKQLGLTMAERPIVNVRFEGDAGASVLEDPQKASKPEPEPKSRDGGLLGGRLFGGKREDKEETVTTSESTGKEVEDDDNSGAFFDFLSSTIPDSDSKESVEEAVIAEETPDARLADDIEETAEDAAIIDDAADVVNADESEIDEDSVDKSDSAEQ